MYRGERFNGYSHLLGTLLAIIAATALIVYGANHGDAWKVVSFSIYGATLIMLFASSTLYHSTRGMTKSVFRKFDHGAIYLLIAGTYTPFTLGVLRGAWGWTLFGLIWGLAAAGVVLKSMNRMSHPHLSTGLYLLMGWLVLIAIKPLVASVPTAGLWWLVAGGVAYTAGVVFYATDSRWRYGHFVWHLFVMAGTACHFVAVYAYAG